MVIEVRIGRWFKVVGNSDFMYPSDTDLCYYREKLWMGDIIRSTQVAVNTAVPYVTVIVMMRI